MRRIPFAFILSILCGALAGAAFAQTKTRLIVYSTLEVEHIAKFKAAFEVDNPDIEISWGRDSTGIITAKLLAEKDNPRGDAIWGLAATSMMSIMGMTLGSDVTAPLAPPPPPAMATSPFPWQTGHPRPAAFR